MIVETLPPNLNFMSLGTNCLFTFLPDRIRGPLDNIQCLGPESLYALMENNYLSLFLDKDNFKEGTDDFSKTCFINEKLNYRILHNNYDDKYIGEHIKRVHNFYKFLKQVETSENYYFLLSLSRSEIELRHLIPGFKIFLEKYNLMEKTFVVVDPKYEAEFKNVIPISPFELNPAENINNYLDACNKSIREVWLYFLLNRYKVRKSATETIQF